MRRLKVRGTQQQSWGFLFGIVVSVALFSLLVLILMGAGLTGFAPVELRVPSMLNITLDFPFFPEQTVVEGDVEVQIDGPWDSQTRYYGRLDDTRKEMRVVQALDAEQIPYTLAAATPKIESASPSTTLVYTDRGSQQFIFRLSKSTVIQNIGMSIHGLAQDGSYPSFLKLDANRDGQYEWEYVGDFLEFNETFLLPAGLKENQENTVTIDEKNAYYCELFTLPRGKDFLVSAKYGVLNPGGDLEVVLFSASGSGDTIKGLGGTEACDLDDNVGPVPAYHSCPLKTSFVVRGQQLLCLHNANTISQPTNLYEVSRDLDKNSGHRCGPILNGQTSCVAQQGDFFIKVQAAAYTGVLDKRVLLPEGAPETLLSAKLNEQLKTCSAFDNYCFLVLEMLSETKGTLYLDALDIVYSDQQTLVHEKNFYTVSFLTPPIITLAGKDLLKENVTLTLPLELLQLTTPVLKAKYTSKNLTLEAGLSPGPSARTVVEVVRENMTGGNATFTGNFSEDVAFYKQLFTQLLGEYEPILTFGGYKDRMETALLDLNQYSVASRSGDSNLSLKQLEDDLLTQIKTLPQYVASLGSSSFTPSLSASDLQDEFVYPQQRSEKSKQQLAYLQQQYAPLITVETLEIVLFNKQQQLFTLIEHSTSAPFSAGKMLALFPSSFGSSLSTISFTKNPDATLRTSPLTVSWDIGSLSGTMQYIVKGNLLSAADDLRVIFIPEQIPEQVEEPRARCGDGLCSVLVSDSQKIYLEDAESCPVDCGGGGASWTWIGILLLVVVLLLYYFGGLYKGPWNIQDVLQRLKKGGGTPRSRLFSSATDEQNLRAYVQNTLKKGISVKGVTETLLNRGWTKQQIDAVLKQAKP